MNYLRTTISKSALVSLFVLGMVTTGCQKDFLDLQPLDKRVEENFYKTEADATEALVSVYDVLQWNTQIGFHPTPMLADVASDDVYAGGGSRSDAPNIIEIDQHRMKTTNNELKGLWGKHYTGIYRANLFLEKIAGVTASDEVKKRMIAEAKFLRAHFYFDLVRFYENVPLVLKPLVNPAEYSQAQATPKAVYDQIALDLEEAMADLPAATLRANQGRATKWAAKALLARTFLFYNGVYKQDLQAGAVVVNSQRALMHLNETIDQSGHNLLGDYATIFKKANEFSVESVWEISYSDENPWYDWGYIQGGDGNMQPQMQGPRVKNPDKEAYKAGWSFAPVTQDLYAAYEEGDLRREASILVETELSEGKAGLNIGFQHTGYFSKKYTTAQEYTPAAGQPELNWGNNYRSIRFSDVLLMAAELEVITGGGNAQKYLDRVRSRVSLGSKPATLANIYQERRVELALEGIRYWDLLRRGLDVAEQAINAQSGRGPLYDGDQVDFSITFNPATKGFFPIPQSEIDISNGLLKKNVGY